MVAERLLRTALRRMLVIAALAVAVGLTIPSASAQVPARRTKAAAPRDGKVAEPKPPEIPEAVVEQVKPSVAYIDGKHGTGSGFFVLPDVIATNSHVIRHEMLDDVFVRFISKAGADQGKLKVKLLFEDKDRDLALLWVAAQSNRPPLPLLQGFEPSPNKAVFVVGNPSQSDRFGEGATRVNATGIGRADEIVTWHKMPYVQIKVAARNDRIDVGHGNSGGPVFDVGGRVVGVVTASADDRRTGRPLGTYCCVPAAAVQTAVGGLGPADGWAAKASAANVRHAVTIAAVNLRLNAEIAEIAIKKRWNLAVPIAGRYSGQAYLADTNLIDRFRSLDKQCTELSAPAVRLAFEKNEASAAWRRDLVELRENVQQLRRYAQGKFNRSEYERCRKLVDESGKAFQRLKEASGLSDLTAKEMSDRMRDAVNSSADR